jgi:aldehyde dehydrogenase (NAD+)
VESSERKEFANIDPATAQVIGTTCEASDDDVDRAIGAARHAFDTTTWRLDHEFRRHCLGQFQAAIRAASDELRAVVVAEAGSPIALTYAFQVDDPIADLGYWLPLTTDFEYRREMGVAEQWGVRSNRFVCWEPVGVVGAITPWNFPLFLNLAKLGPALAAGCTVVLKPAPETPWSATVLGRLIAEATDIPPGVVNIVAGSDHRVGEAIVSDPRVDMITFTGSTATGRRIMRVASGTVKRLFLELGGKSAHIVLDDADLAAEASAAAMGVTIHSGQGCAINSRLLVPRALQAEMVALVAEALTSTRYGPPTDPEVMMGPVISAGQLDRVLGYVERAASGPAVLETGGCRAVELGPGYFVEPTLFSSVEPASELAQEEVFGPVLAVIPYENDDDAVTIANNSIYGLAGSVSGGDQERALAVAERLRTGSVSVNGGASIGPDLPFGGYRQSGFGREWGEQGFLEYLQTKSIGRPALP